MGRPYLGTGWFCAPDSEDHAPMELRDAEADRLARSLGVSRAKDKKRGTSILILEPVVDREKLLGMIATYWWPRLRDGKLIVTVERDGKPHAPTFDRESTLGRFVDLYDLAQEKRSEGEGERSFALKYGKRELGVLALTVLDRTDGDDSEDGEEDLVPSIALTRSLGMVNDYYRWSQGPRRDVIGVFRAHRDVDEDLRMTEDHEHVRWSKDAARASDEQKKIAEEVYKRIRAEHAKFVKAYEPPASTDDRSLEPLRRYFGALFRAPGKHIPREDQPIEIRDIRAEPVVVDSRLKVRGSATIRWKGSHAQHLRVGVKATLAESEVNPKTGDSIRLLADFAGTKIEGTEPHLRLLFEPEDAIVIRCESEPYSPEWTASLEFSAEPE